MTPPASYPKGFWWSAILECKSLLICEGGRLCLIVLLLTKKEELKGLVNHPCLVSGYQFIEQHQKRNLIIMK